MSTHTPTPWTYDSGAVYAADIPIAHMDRNAGNGTAPVERDLNAKLIVRAVNSHDELVAVLQGIMTAADNGEHRVSLDNKWSDKARATLQHAIEEN